MNDLKIGDRVRVISESEITKPTRDKSIVGMTGTVKDLDEISAGVEFDDDIGGHGGSWNGKNGHCWDILYERLEKIEETGEETAVDTEKETKEEVKEEVKGETKADTLEQKILEVLREEIGVEIGEEFEAYESGEKHWVCKFEENGFTHKMNDKFLESGLWKSIISNFRCFKFKRKPFMPRYSEEYFYLYTDFLRNEYMPIDVKLRRWLDGVFDHGMLALGNVFRTKEEALNGKDKLLERLEKLRNGE